MWIRTNKSRGKIYYQLMDGQGKHRKIVAHLGSAGKVYEIFQFWLKYKDDIGDLIELKNQFVNTKLPTDKILKKSLEIEKHLKDRVSDEKKN